MEKKGLHEIRHLFLDFFNSKEHLVIPSYPLIPLNDKSLLLVNAGMAPLKPYFAGTETPPSKRMATCQKCIRTGDIENVGKTARHATFFEMLGNFSFGDYFKKESIVWGWEFVTQYLKMPVDRLWASVYSEDDEAYELWNKTVGLPENRIVRLGKEDNFWEIGVGPCGPCSEIYFDRGEKYGCSNENCKPGCDCDRFVEFWNHVFTQFDKDEKGIYNPLPSPNIDTGMGLERVACIMQEADSIFEIDTIQYILYKVCEETNSKYGLDHKSDISIRIITDHIRSIVFLISDGVLPSNEGRGYVLRRLLRRAALHGKLLGHGHGFLYKLVESVVKMYGEHYTEIKEKEDHIKKIVKAEEEKFQETIHQGIEILNQYISELNSSNEKVLKGEYAFKLYDTFGFPLDLTKEVLEEKNLTVDQTGFEEEMFRQRQRARQARAGENAEGWKDDVLSNISRNFETEFIGYGTLQSDGTVTAVLKENKEADRAEINDEIILFIDKTPFYAESGGQAGDTGILFNDTFKGNVLNTKKTPDNKIYHIVKVEEGTVKAGDEVKTCVNADFRSSTEKNHTATHLLHKTLKEIVGPHVQQAGSFVSRDRLRFDFIHFESLSKDQINKIEESINEQVMRALNVSIIETTQQEADNLGAVALFGEKYGETVRVVKAGDYCMELCGGTHVRNSSEIGLFLIISESSAASGIRRIEAVTGLEAYRHIKEQQKLLEHVSGLLKSQRSNILVRIENLISEVKEKDKEINELKNRLLKGEREEVLKNTQIINDVKVVIAHMGSLNMDDLRKAGDALKEKTDSGIIVLASENEGKANFIAASTKDILNKGFHAGNIVKEAARITGGGGGGRPDMAQAGGRNPEKIDEALNFVKELLKSQIKQ